MVTAADVSAAGQACRGSGMPQVRHAAGQACRGSGMPDPYWRRGCPAPALRVPMKRAKNHTRAHHSVIHNR